MSLYDLMHKVYAVLTPEQKLEFLVETVRVENLNVLPAEVQEDVELFTFEEVASYGGHYPVKLAEALGL